MQCCSHRGSACRFAFAWVLSTLFTMALVACVDSRAVPRAPSPNEVLAEMSRRSDISEAELKQRLKSCDADQQSMYFCAFRDFVDADIQLERIAAEQTRRHPECKVPLEHQLHDLKQQRDSACAKSAEDEYGAGSMTQTALAICASSSTKPLIDKIAAMDDCPLRQPRSD
jgi:hypothetical protein